MKGHGTQALHRASAAMCGVVMHRCRCVDASQSWSGIGPMALTVLAKEVLFCWAVGCRV